MLTEVLKEQTETPSLFMHSPLIHYNLTSIFSCFIDTAHLDIKNYLLITKSNILYHFSFHSFASPPHLSSYQLLCTLSSTSDAYFLFLLLLQLSYSQSNIYHSPQSEVYLFLFLTIEMQSHALKPFKNAHTLKVRTLSSSSLNSPYTHINYYHKCLIHKAFNQDLRTD